MAQPAHPHPSLQTLSSAARAPDPRTRRAAATSPPTAEGGGEHFPIVGLCYKSLYLYSYMSMEICKILIHNGTSGWLWSPLFFFQ